MPRYQPTPDYEHGSADFTGVLLVNLGTPDAPTTPAVRRFLKPFLSDPRVVEYPRLLWWLILNGIILRIRPSRSAKAYREIWTDEGSPLMLYSQALADGVRARLEQDAPDTYRVELAMTYGELSVSGAIDKLQASGARRLVVLPLYPQYSATTTASIYDAVFGVLKDWRWVPELRLIQHYHDHPPYIDALAASVREHWDRDGRPDRLLLSFHGIPRRNLDAGDPYFCECHTTGRLLAERLELQDGAWQLTFQSRFGRQEWLRPYTDHTLKAWGKEGVGRVDVVCPGFSADCLETLEEIAEQNRELFLHAGGKELRYIPALNARPDHAQALAQLLVRHLQGWDDGSAWTPERLQLCQQRARSLGAER